MKKKISFGLAFAMVLSLTACGGADKALAERAGYYKATNVVQNGEELDLDRICEFFGCEL